MDRQVLRWCQRFIPHHQELFLLIPLKGYRVWLSHGDVWGVCEGLHPPCQPSHVVLPVLPGTCMAEKGLHLSTCAHQNVGRCCREKGAGTSHRGDVESRLEGAEQDTGRWSAGGTAAFKGKEPSSSCCSLICLLLGGNPACLSTRLRCLVPVPCP